MAGLTLKRNMRRRLLYVAGGFVAVAATALVAHAVFAPTVLRIAVGPVGSSNVRVVVGFLQAFQRDRATIRLKLVMTDGSAASAKALEDKKVHLAIVRSDVGLPPSSASVAILRREALAFVTRPGAGIEKIGDLKGKTVGVPAISGVNEQLLRTILQHYDVPVSEVVRVSGNPADVMHAAQENRTDATFIVAPTNERLVRSILQAYPTQDGVGAGLLPISDADVLVEQNPAIESYEISRGAFSTNPAVPDATMTTLAVTHRLVARRDVSEATISELARLLSTLRLQVAQEVQAANQLELPSTEDRASRLPTHPGTIAYVEGETRTFFERYGDFIYIGIMAFSLLGSALAALASSILGRRKSANAPDQRLKDLLRLTQAVGEAGPDELGAIESESRMVIAELMASLGEKDIEVGRVATISFLASEFRRALGERQAQLMPRAAE